jgi:hypothetical protein
VQGTEQRPCGAFEELKCRSDTGLSVAAAFKNVSKSRGKAHPQSGCLASPLSLQAFVPWAGVDELCAAGASTHAGFSRTSQLVRLPRTELLCCFSCQNHVMCSFLPRKLQFSSLPPPLHRPPRQPGAPGGQGRLPRIRAGPQEERAKPTLFREPWDWAMHWG